VQAVKRCWLAQLPDAGPCDGRLIRAHLLPQQLMKRGGVPRRYLADSRGWVWACGGPMGLSGHHGKLDSSAIRPLRIPRGRLPFELEVMAEEIGLAWWLDRRYGERLA
jgi:hypothetical protein